MAYWDTSCLVKLYVPEPDSAAFRMHVLSGATIVTSEIARLELWTTVRRKEAAGDLVPGGGLKALRAYDSDLSGGFITVHAMSAMVVSNFESLIDQCHGFAPAIPLRTLDAIHLATAAVSGETQVVATDRRLREAAVKIGLSVYPL
jgi:predicted nucleic acid-binding protein